MKKPDARLLNPTTQNYLRQQAIGLREQGKRMIEIAEYLGVHRNTVTGWWQEYQQQKTVALEQQHRGAKFGAGRSRYTRTRSTSANHDAGAFSFGVGR